MGMNEVLTSLGATLRRVYGAIVRKPMPWRMIDTLATLEETCERESPPRDAVDGPPAAVQGQVPDHFKSGAKPGAAKSDL